MALLWVRQQQLQQQHNLSYVYRMLQCFLRYDDIMQPQEQRYLVLLVRVTLSLYLGKATPVARTVLSSLVDVS